MTWSDPDCPKTGYRCEDMHDNGDDRTLCEMCEHQWLRFVHHMVHPSRPDVTIRCGNICAGRMEANPDAADRREREAQRSARAGDFQPDWRIAAESGNPWFKHHGWRCTVYPDQKRGSGFKYVISRDDVRPAHFGRTNYPDREAAMEACRIAFAERRRDYWKKRERDAQLAAEEEHF